MYYGEEATERAGQKVNSEILSKAKEEAAYKEATNKETAKEKPTYYEVTAS